MNQWKSYVHITYIDVNATLYKRHVLADLDQRNDLTSVCDLNLVVVVVIHVAVVVVGVLAAEEHL